MKVGSKIIFLFKDAEGFGSAILDTLQQNPNSHFQRNETSFELPLNKYGIHDSKASGDLVHFIDQQGSYQVSVLLLQNYEPPVLACAINEVLVSLGEENSFTKPILILPYFVPASRINWEMTNSAMDSKRVSLCGTHVGPETEFTLAMLEGTQKPPPSFQIHYEPLACLLLLVRILKLPAVLLIGARGLQQSIIAEAELETLYKMGEFLTRNVGLCFVKDRIQWNPTEKSKGSQEPWRALYG